jgi:cytochrome c peroxidase
MGDIAMRSAVGILCLVTGGAAVLPGCTDETVFTGEQRDTLGEYRLPAKPPADPSNQYGDDARAAVLGKKLFFDTRFSGSLSPPNDGVSNGSLGVPGTTGRVACDSCHQPELGGTDHRSRPLATSLGASYTGRNAPTVINAAYSDVAIGGWQFWDGRKDSLWSHALGPPESAVEQHGTRLGFAHVIQDHYQNEYEAVFGPLPDLSDTGRFPSAGKPGDPSFDAMAAADREAINRLYANFGKAIEAYERRLVSTGFAPSPFDQMLAGDDTAMTPAAVRGARLFIGKAACNECHRGAAFTDFKFHNIGCPQEGDFVLETDVGRFAGVGQLKGDIYNRAGVYSDRVDDSHLTGLTAVAADVGAFKTATLRNLSKTGPYMHDGVYRNLWDVVNHYNFGGGTGAYSGTKEVTIAPLLLDAQEIDDLVEFLSSLDDGPALATPDFPEGLVAAPALPN